MSTTHPRHSRRALPPLMSSPTRPPSGCAALYAGGQQGMLLRIGVGTKGCSGLSYEMSWVDAPGPGDEVVTTRALRCGGPQGQPVPDRHGDGLRE